MMKVDGRLSMCKHTGCRPPLLHGAPRSSSGVALLHIRAPIDLLHRCFPAAHLIFVHMWSGLIPLLSEMILNS